MPAITLQVQLPADPKLSPEQLIAITGRQQVAKQVAWLQEQGWVFELAADGSVLVGSLYAHLRLAGLNPADAALPDIAAGFDLGKVR